MGDSVWLLVAIPVLTALLLFLLLERASDAVLSKYFRHKSKFVKDIMKEGGDEDE